MDSSQRYLNMPSFSEQTKIAFPAEIQMISCHNDDQDVTFETVGPYDLPVPGKGTFCAEAMVHSLWDDPRCTSPEHITWIDLLQRMSTYLQDQGVHTARPRLSSSRLLQVQQPLVIVPSTMGNHSVKRAVLIGIHYVGHEHALTNCHNNVNSMASYLMKVHGFQEHNVTILMDNSLRQEPTRHNILRAFQRICKLSKAGDVAVIQFSGKSIISNCPL